jgi:cellulose synthase/poly-beta-1,6-N-acetylglucosamine synthase-like glycosyltransferase
MKKFLWIIPLLLAGLLFLNKDKQEEIPPSSSEMYLSNHEFNFIHIYKEDDPFALGSIEAMFNQDYDNFHIYLLLNDKETTFKTKVELCAKKENKTHLLTIVPIDEDSPLPLLMKDLAEGMTIESFVVYLEDHCLFVHLQLLKELNTFYMEGGERLLIYGNYRHYPSYQKNSKPLDFATSPFKAFSVKHLLGMNHQDETYLFLNEPCYLKAHYLQ